MTTEHGAHLVDTAASPRSLLADLLVPLSEAALHGRCELLVAEMERLLRTVHPGAQAHLVQHAAGIWRHWTSPEQANGRALSAIPVEARDWVEPRLLTPNRLYIPLKPGAVGALVEHDLPLASPGGKLELFRQYAIIALQACELQRRARHGLDEVQAVARVAQRILKSHDIDEILLHITEEAKRLLSADICGVLLREGDEIMMRRCVGNLSPETARLRMSSGQGLAGLVLKHGAPASVDDYVHSKIISQDFFHLAEAESVRSALAAPLHGTSDLIGVLEVWRRRPSNFTQDDNDRLMALASLTSIAIDNARLYVAQKQSVEQLAEANTALTERYHAAENLSVFTQVLIQLLLDDSSLSDIARAASSRLDTTVLILDSDGRQLAAGGHGALAPAVIDAVCEAIGQVSARDESHNLRTADSSWHAKPILVNDKPVGWTLCVADPQPSDLVVLALSQVATVVALHWLKQRAASRARAETIYAVVWDLLSPEELIRTAAIDRAAEMQLDLSGPLRLFIIQLQLASGLETGPLAPAHRRQLLAVLDELTMRNARAVALRGLSLAVLCDDDDLDTIERFAVQLTRRLQAVVPEHMVLVGGSSACASAPRLHVAYREAHIALDVARQMNRSGAMVYDRAGILGLLLSLRHESGMQKFLKLNFGRLLEEDADNRDRLLRTLRVYLNTNCSQVVTAQNLDIHRKTVANRIARIGELTGLDLTVHDDRLVADIALYVHHMLSSGAATAILAP